MYIILLIRREKNHFLLFKNCMVLNCKTLSLLHLRMRCGKFSWNWFSECGEEDFKILSMYFRYFVFISHWKRHTCSPSFEQTWILSTQGWFGPSLVAIGPVVSEKKILKFYCHIFAISKLSPLAKRSGPSFDQTWIPTTQRCFVQSVLKISLVLMEEKI